MLLLSAHLARRKSTGEEEDGQDPITDRAVQLLKFRLITTKTIFDKQKRSIEMKFRFTSNRFFNCHTNQSDFTIFHHSWNQTKFQSIFRLLDETKNRLIFFRTGWQPLLSRGAISLNSTCTYIRYIPVHIDRTYRVRTIERREFESCTKQSSSV